MESGTCSWRPTLIVMSGILVATLWLGVAKGSAQNTSMWGIRPAVGESGELGPSPRVEEEPPAAAGSGTSRQREWLFAPLPVINPTLDNGLAIVAGVLYPLSARDLVSPVSATFLLALATSNDSWIIGGGQTLHLAADRHRAVFAGGYANLNVEYFGIGTDAGDAGQSILLNEAGGAMVAEWLMRVRGPWYVGPRYRVLKVSTTASVSDSPVALPVDDIELRTALLGPHLERDTRNDNFYPTRGTLVDVEALFAGSRVGGQRTYQVYQASLSTYFSPTSRQVLAGRINSCRATQAAPFYDLCLIGQYQDLRGYPAGQYRDHLLLSGQAEYRLRVWWRFGVTVFGGLGQVAENLDAFTGENTLPSGGAGLRFRLTRQNHINLRIDYAWGRNSDALYITVGEAF
jgi:hypothetical protein